MFKSVFAALIGCGLASAAESFEKAPAGPVDNCSTEYGSLRTEAGQARILHDAKLAHSGSAALHLQGGESCVVLSFSTPLAEESSCEFWIQRWTRKGDFAFSCTAVTPEGDKEVATAGNNLGVGGYKRRVEFDLPAGTTALRLSCKSPADGGVLIDDLVLHSGAMRVSEIKFVNPGPFPLLKRAEVNPAFALQVQTVGKGNAVTPEKLSFRVHPADSIASVTLRTGAANGKDFNNTRVLGKADVAADGSVTITCTEPLSSGENWLWVDAEPSTGSSVGGVVEFRELSASVGGKTAEGEAVQQRIGYMVAVPGERVGNQPDKADPRACVSFRIPGLICTRKGTLVGCFDARYCHEGDLCADIDVATVRSTDGGQTWTEPAVAMDSGPGPENGNGDACILQDRKGRIWLQALAGHFGGGAILGVSKSGQGEDRTGQWVMTYSTDEGKSWKKEFINPTREIKKDEWTCILAGPGSGICTRRGVIVFPAQIWQNGAKIRCRSTICYSKDNGRSWHFGEGVPHSTSECQVVELKDGSLMLNCRNEARSGKRIVYVTKDLGKTWEPHESNDSALREPVCQASIIRARSDEHGSLLLFSNPKSGGRDHMTIRVSRDEGKTWSEGYEYDRRPCLGYSCLAQVDEKHIGVFYEAAHTLKGSRGIGFLLIPLDTVISEKTEEAGTPVQTEAGEKSADKKGGKKGNKKAKKGSRSKKSRAASED